MLMEDINIWERVDERYMKTLLSLQTFYRKSLNLFQNEKLKKNAWLY